MGLANESQRYIVTLCLIGLAHTLHDPCISSVSSSLVGILFQISFKFVP